MIWTFDCQTRRPLSNPLIISGKPSTVSPYSLGHMVHIETERWRNPNKKAPADMFGNVVDWAFPCMYVFKSLFPSSSKTRQVGWGKAAEIECLPREKKNWNYINQSVGQAFLSPQSNTLNTIRTTAIKDTTSQIHYMAILPTWIRVKATWVPVLTIRKKFGQVK